MTSLRRCEEILSHPGKPLKNHLEQVGETISATLGALPFSLPFSKKIFCEVGCLAGYYHDFGKGTSFFQEYLKEKNPDRKAELKNQKETNHSLLSAVATYFAVKEMLKSKSRNEQSDFLEFLPVAAFVAVRRHHSDLESVLEDVRLENVPILQKQVNHLYFDYLDFLPYRDAVFKKLHSISDVWPLRKILLLKWLKKGWGILPHLIFYLLYSLLLDADKHEAALGTVFGRREIPPTLVENYRSAKGFDVPRSDIGMLRDRIYRAVLAQLENPETMNNRIFSLTAPTGSGKTLAVLDFALKLRSHVLEEKGFAPRIIYALPFLSIIDQNARVLKDVIRCNGLELFTDILLIHHHLSDYSYRTIEEEYGSDKSDILVEGWNSEIIITTFVQFFHTIFSNRNRAIRKFNKIVGSIVILDEIQSFPHKYWLLFREMAESMAEYFNTYFVMVTATQPAIFEKIYELLPNNRKFFNSLNRYQIKIKSNPQNLNAFSQGILEKLKISKKSTLIVLNTIKAAKVVFEMIREELQKSGFETYYLSSHVIPKERLERIEQIQNSSNLKVVVSTQLVEAGIDIDLDLVVRDFGPLDSINQVAGRANRNQKSTAAEVEVLCLKDDNGRNFYSYIYDSLLIENTKKILSKSGQIPESAFLNITGLYFDEVRSHMADDYSKSVLREIYNLNYEEVGRFRLIEEEDKVDIFVEADEGASIVWQKFREVQSVKDFSERKRLFQKIRSDFYQYVISVSAKKAVKNLPPEVDGIRFIPYAQLKEFYDFETGFIAEKSLSIW